MRLNPPREENAIGVDDSFVYKYHGGI